MRASAWLPDEVDVQRDLCRRSLFDFIENAWHIVEPARAFQSNWHIGAIAEHLEAVSRGQIRRLVVNVPPGSMKSLSCCVFWPAWQWTHTPNTKWIFASYSDAFSRRDSLRCRAVMESQWYRDRWGDMWKPNRRVWGAEKFANDQAGMRMTGSISGKGIGEHADIQCADDPIKPIEVTGAASMRRAALEKALTWWDETMSTRVADPRTSRRVIIMQRLHDADIAGAVLRRGGYDHLCLPMRAERKCVVQVPHPCSVGAREPHKPSGTTIGFKDPRPEGELLWEQRFPAEEVDKQAKELGPRGAAAQHQQRPMPAGGGIFKQEYVRYWTKIPRGDVRLIQSWDCTFKALNDSDYVVGQVWLQHAADYYLVDQVRARLTVSGTVAAVRALSQRWPRAIRKLIEDKANGPAVADLLSGEIPGIHMVNPEGGKEARANAVEPLWAAGNVYIPDPRIAPWVEAFIAELVSFPGGVNDDMVDSMTQALIYLHDKAAARYVSAMNQLRGGR